MKECKQIALSSRDKKEEFCGTDLSLCKYHIQTSDDAIELANRPGMQEDLEDHICKMLQCTTMQLR